MRKDDILEKFVSMLARFTDKELRELKTLFQNPNASHAIVNLIEGTLELRRLRSSNRSIARTVAQKKGEPARNDIEREEIPKRSVSKGISPINNFSHRFAGILQSKKLFPSTKDVVKAVNESFSWGIEYEDFYKRGRRDLIQHCLGRLADIREDKRRRMIRSFVKDIRAKKGSEDLDRQYRELFKILAGDE